jgi:predicted nuclease with TOPRIM domain
MLEQLDQIERIEIKLNKLLGKMKQLRKENELLLKELKTKQAQVIDLKQKNEELAIKMNMRTASNATQDETSKVLMEKRINEYIKEIDRCIALLGDED